MLQTGSVAMSTHVEERLCCPAGSEGEESVEESKGKYESGKIKIATASFPVACCLPREAANSTQFGGLVIAPSCPAEIILAVISTLGFLFSSRRVRGLQASVCSLLHLGSFPRLCYFDHEHL